MASLTSPGLHADGAGLCLMVDPSGTKRWTCLFQWQGRRRQMGLGSIGDVTLADARELGRAARKLVRSGVDLILERRRAAPAAGKSFGGGGRRAPGRAEGFWKNPADRQQWRLHLTEYAAPLRRRPVDQIFTDDVLAVLRPIWRAKPETASRVRARIERVLDAAKARGFRHGDNPARWRGHLALLMAENCKLTRGHHAALPYEEAPAFLARLRAAQGMGARGWIPALHARAGERGAGRRLALKAALWTEPAVRMKAGRSTACRSAEAP